MASCERSLYSRSIRSGFGSKISDRKVNVQRRKARLACRHFTNNSKYTKLPLNTELLSSRGTSWMRTHNKTVFTEREMSLRVIRSWDSDSEFFIVVIPRMIALTVSGTNCLWGPLLVLLSLRELVVAVPVLGDLGMSASSYVERTAEYSVCDTRRKNTVILRNPPTSFALPVFGIRGGGSAEARDGRERTATQFGRISDDEFRLTPEQINSFHEKGCITLEGVLSHDEVDELLGVFERFVAGEIEVPGKDYCDMSKPFGIPYEEWSLVNCMLPTRYFPPLRNNVYERLTASIARQLFPHANMTKDYDQFLNKRPGKSDAVFAWHQDMAYWPGPQALNVSSTDTCTFSLAMDDSTPENGCLRYLRGSGITKTLRPHPTASEGWRENQTRHSTKHLVLCVATVFCFNYVLPFVWGYDLLR